MLPSKEGLGERRRRLRWKEVLARGCVFFLVSVLPKETRWSLWWGLSASPWSDRQCRAHSMQVTRGLSGGFRVPCGTHVPRNGCLCPQAPSASPNASHGRL